MWRAECDELVSSAGAWAPAWQGFPVIRQFAEADELADDPGRVDVDAVHAFLSKESSWAEGRSRETVERLVNEAQRVVGLYHGGRQVGFCRAATDVAYVYLADVYVLSEHRGRGLGF